jgi:TRAP-type uncharacterized transport system substrate-binding protein
LIRPAMFVSVLAVFAVAVLAATHAAAQGFWPFSSPTPPPQAKPPVAVVPAPAPKPKPVNPAPPAVKQPVKPSSSQAAGATSALPAMTPVEKKREAINQWVVGVAAGRIEDAPLRLAAELADVTDDGDELRVMPVITRGVFENFTDILYLRGVDTAIVYSDAMEHFKTKDKIAGIEDQVVFIANLFVAEMHVLVRPGINSLRDLAGKKVNFNSPGTAAAFTGPIVFDRLGIDVVKQFDPQRDVLAAMTQTTDVAAVVMVTTKPAPPMVQAAWPEGLKLLPVEYTSKLEDLYLPANLEHADYPKLIPEGKRIETIAVPVVLAAANPTPGTDRHRRLARFVDRFVDRLAQLQKPPHNPNWKSVNLAASVPGWKRFPAMQQKLDAMTASNASRAPTAIDRDLALKQAGRVAPHDAAEQARLFQQFLEWNQGKAR